MVVWGNINFFLVVWGSRWGSNHMLRGWLGEVPGESNYLRKQCSWSPGFRTILGTQPQTASSEASLETHSKSVRQWSPEPRT